MIEIDSIVRPGWIITFARQGSLGEFESRSHLHLFADSHKERVRIRGQQAEQMRTECRQVQLPIGDKCGHASAAVATRNRDTVNDTLGDARKGANHLFDFGSRNILTLPTKS